MKKKFTFLMAVMMLLTFFTTPQGMWGQRTTATYSLTPDNESTSSSATSYITTLTEFTYDEVSWKMNQWNPSTLQVKTNESYATSEFRFYNTSAFPGKITQVVITFSSLTIKDGNKLMFLGGTSEVTATTGGTVGTWNSTAKTLTWTPGSSDNYTYFAFYQNGKAASGSNYLCGSDAIVVTYETGGSSTVATPTFSPAAGLVVSGTEVEISCTTPGATIHYTTNGDAPTGSSPQYTGAITVNEAMIIKAIGVIDGMTNSEIATAAYTIATPVATPTFSPAAGTYTTNQDVTISCATDGATIYYTTNGSDPTTSSTEYSSAINVSTNTTIKAFAVNDGMIDSEIATASYTFAATLPFSFDNGKVAIATTKGLTQSGLGSDYANSPKLRFDDTGDYMILNINERPGTLTFDIKGNSFSGGTFKVQTSADGETFTDLKSYSMINNSTAQNESFNNLDASVRYIKWIYTNKSSGNVALGNITLAKLAPSISADDVDIDYNATGGSISFTVNNPIDGGAISASVTEGDWITLGSETTSPISFTCSVNDGDERTATVRLTYTYNTNETKTKYVTITQAAVPAAPGNWVLTSLKQLTPSDVFVIVGKKGDAWYAITNDKGTSNPPVPVAVTVAGNTLSGTIADNIKWNISGNATDGYTFYPNGDEDNWLFCNTTAASSSNDNIRVGTGDRKAFVFDENDYLVTNDSYVDRYLSIYNTQDWRGYINTASAVTMSFYKYVAGSIITKDIDGYGEGDDKWYLIASPITSVASSSVAAGTYDLYKFDQSAGQQWVNYKAHNDFTTLNAGTGYLYANKNDIQLSFVGTAYTGNGQFTLAYDENVTNNAKGWNLIGNPWNTAATIGEKDYYRINDTGTGIMAGVGNIAVMEGVFVQAASAGETVTFTAAKGTTEKSVNNALVINLNRNDKVIDRVIARLNSDRQLSKLTLFDDDTKIYIPQNDANYAIAAMDDNTQVFSLNFHAKTTGKYTLSLAETSNLSYVHLFDRMTGEDVDMLLEDSYSFIGSPADSEERFIVRLSYNASPTDSETFAYQSGNGIIVNGEGELQIFDVTGRKVMTTTINGVQTVNGLNNGLYIFKLNEKTQKIVVR